MAGKFSICRPGYPPHFLDIPSRYQFYKYINMLTVLFCSESTSVVLKIKPAFQLP